MANYKKFVSPENQLILQTTVKKISDGSFFKEKYGSGGAIKFLCSPVTRVLRAVARKGFRGFTPVLNTFKWYKFDFEIKNSIWPFWWRQPLWRQNLSQTETYYHLVNNRSLSGKFGREMKRNVKDT